MRLSCPSPLRGRIRKLGQEMVWLELGGGCAPVESADQFTVIPVPDAAYDLAASYCDMIASSLRAADKLHLAIAALGGHALATLDARLAEGAQAVEVRVEKLGRYLLRAVRTFYFASRKASSSG